MRLIESPANWKSAELAARTDWIHALSADELAEIEAALKSVRDKKLAFAEVRKEDFPLKLFPKLAARVQDYLENGPGVFMIRGLPAGKYATEDLRMMYWGLGKYLGTAVSQSREGDHIGDVRDLRIPPDSPFFRGYQTAGGGVFHCDTCDVAALFVLRTAKAGGISLVCSSIAIHNEMVRTHPELAEALYQPMPWSMLEQQRPGEPKWYLQPIFSLHEGHFSCRYVRPHLTQAQKRFPDAPRLTANQIAGMDLFDEMVKRPDFQLVTNFQPGDLQFCNNHVAMHARTAFEDFAEPERRRHLLRLWLSVPNSRPLSPLMGHIYKDRSSGAVRGGFQPQVPGRMVFETSGGETEVT
jgi:hypothetical protein